MDEDLLLMLWLLLVMEDFSFLGITDELNLLIFIYALSNSLMNPLTKFDSYFLNFCKVCFISLSVKKFLKSFPF